MNKSRITSLVMSRRNWLQSAGLALTACSRPAVSGPVILLHSGWQTVNIGDIAHSPGLLQLLKQYIPEAHVILWPPRTLDRGVTPMIHRHFPHLEIVEGEWEDPAVAAAVRQADFLLHGSGPSIFQNAVVEWHSRTDKPFGIYGVTVSNVTDELRSFLSDASFIFTRETQSLAHLQQAGITGPVMDFAPDATFAFTLRDEEKTQAFMTAHGLTDQAFICVVPRLRKTPYYKIYPDSARWSAPEVIRDIDTLNAQHAEKDHAKVREAIICWVRETGNKVAVVPEMTYELDIMDELIIDPLPRDVKKQVVKRTEFWLPDEAASLYARAQAVLSFECHSPIIAVAQGTPACYLRQPEDTIKGQMWYDIGLSDWVFEIEETTGRQIADRLMEIHTLEEQSGKILQQAMAVVTERQTASMTVVRKCLERL